MAQTNVQAFSGNVGIGTDNPGAPLEAHGPDLTGQAEGTTGLISRHVVDDEDGVLNTFGIMASNGGETIGLQTQIDGRQFATDIAGGWNTGASSRYMLCLQPYKGRVAIGRTNAIDSLHVMGAISTQNGGDPAATPQVLFRSGASNTNSWEMKANVSDSVAGNFTIDRLDAGTPIKFVIQNNGNLGIGTATSDNRLHIYNNADNVGYVVENNARTFTMGLRGDTSDVFAITDDTAGAFRMTVQTNGNVGIGTATSDNRLHIYNNADNVGYVVENNARTFTMGLRGDTSDVFAIQDDTAGAMRLQIDTNGSVGINCTPSTLLEVKKNSDGPAVRLGSNDGILEIAALATTYGHETVTMQSYIDQGNSGTFASADRNLLAIQPYAGRVGIGITNPSHLLDVNGSVGIRGFTYSRLFYSFFHQTGTLSTSANYDVTGSQFTSASGSGSVDDGWYHAIAMRYDSNPFEKCTFTVWYYGSFGTNDNDINSGLRLRVSGGSLRLDLDNDAVNFPTPYMIHLHKFGGQDR